MSSSWIHLTLLMFEKYVPHSLLLQCIFDKSINQNVLVFIGVLKLVYYVAVEETLEEHVGYLWQKSCWRCQSIREAGDDDQSTSLDSLWTFSTDFWTKRKLSKKTFFFSWSWKRLLKFWSFRSRFFMEHCEFQRLMCIELHQ